MANTIQIKRSSANAAPGTLAKGELAWVDHGTGGAAGTLYIGDMTAAGAVVRTVGGTADSAYVSDILANTALTGVPTAPTAANGTSTTQLATTAYVQNSMTANQNPISQAGDTNISGSQSAGHVLIWDGNNSWDDKGLSGDVTMDKDGVTTVNSVAANSVQLGTDTTGNYISTVTGTANEIEVTGSGVEQAAIQIGLPDNVTITGNLIVNGTTTTVDSTVVTVADPIFTLGANLADSKDRGIAMKYGAAAKFSWMGMDESDDKFKYIADATNNGEVITGDLGNAAFGQIDGTLMTASQPNITGVGTISAGVWNGDAIDAARGGFGIDTSGSTGVASVNNGTWSVASETPVELGGTGLQSVAANAILVGANTADMTVLTIGSAGQKLSVSSGGAPEWSDSVDGGTF